MKCIPCGAESVAQQTCPACGSADWAQPPVSPAPNMGEPATPATRKHRKK